MHHQALIYIAGVRWNDMAGTDRRLATVLAPLMPVLWVDPPVPPSLWEGPQIGTGGLGLDQIADGIVRLRAPAPRASHCAARWRTGRFMRDCTPVSGPILNSPHAPVD